MARDIKGSVKLEAKPQLQGIQKFSREIKTLNYQCLRMQRDLMNLFAGFKVFQGLTATFKGIYSQISAVADQIKNTSEAVGLGTEQLQVLGRVAAQSGAKAEDMSSALLRLNKATQSAADGNKQLSERFVRLGIDLQKFKSLSGEKQMERLGIAVAGATDKKQVLADMMALLGDSAAPKLMASLEKLGTMGYGQLAQMAKESGEIIKDETIQAIAEAEATIEKFHQKVLVLYANIISGLNTAWVKVPQMKESIAIYDRFFEAQKKYGDESRETFAAATALADKFAKEGNFKDAELFLTIAERGKDASFSIREVASSYAVLMKNWAKATATLGLGANFGESRVRTLAIRDNIDPDSALKTYTELSEKLAEIKANAAKMAEAQAAAEAEAAAVVAQAAIDAQNAAIEAALDEHDAAIAKLTEQRVARELRAAEQLQQQLEREGERARAAMARFDFERLAPSEQLIQGARDFYAEVERLAGLGVLATEDLTRAQEQLNAQLREAAELRAQEDQQAAIEAQIAAFEALSPALQELHVQFEQLGHTIEGQLSGAISDFVETGTVDMKKLGQSILNDVIKAMLKALVLKPLLGAIGGAMGGMGGVMGSLGKGLAGMRASGGPVARGSSYLVGEKGPELFTPRSSGAIIDANKTANLLAGPTATGGSGQGNVYQIDARGADVGAVSRLERALFRMAGPGVVEKRALAATHESNRRR